MVAGKEDRQHHSVQDCTARDRVEVFLLTCSKCSPCLQKYKERGHLAVFAVKVHFFFFLQFCIPL